MTTIIGTVYTSNKHPTFTLGVNVFIVVVQFSPVAMVMFLTRYLYTLEIVDPIFNKVQMPALKAKESFIVFTISNKWFSILSYPFYGI